MLTSEKPQLEEGPDLRRYWRTLLKWRWVLILGLAVGITAGGLIAFFQDRSQVPVYDATAKLVVQGGQGSALSLIGDIQTGKQLAQYYHDIVQTRPFLQKVSEKLSAPLDAGNLSGKISVKRPQTLIEITARDRDPALAAAIANTTALTLSEDLRDRQLTQIAQLQGALSQYGISQDASISAAQVAAMTNLSIAEEAGIPTTPSNKGLGFGTALPLGAVFGLLAAVVAVFILEQLDETVKSPEELKALTGLTPLGAILQYPTSGADSRPIILDGQGYNTPVAESYKFLRTNLDFAALGTSGLNTLLVTSSVPEEGKTTTAVNLSITAAREGKSVILVDADLRKPALHRIFDLKDHKGLTHLLLGQATLEEVMAPTQVEGLHVIHSGPSPPDSAQVLRTPLMREIIFQLKKRADMVILDSSPLLVITDPMLLVPFMDGIVLVVDALHTKREVVKRGAETLRQANPAFLGVVLNKVSRKSQGGYYYHYYHQYYSGNGQISQQQGHRGLLSKILRKR